MADTKQGDPGSAPMPGTSDQDQSSVHTPQHGGKGVPSAPGTGLSGGVTDIDGRDGEVDDSTSGYSDEDLMRTGGGGRAK